VRIIVLVSCLLKEFVPQNRDAGPFESRQKLLAGCANQCDPKGKLEWNAGRRLSLEPKHFDSPSCGYQQRSP
jgi:hypothetical protein